MSINRGMPWYGLLYNTTQSLKRIKMISVLLWKDVRDYCRFVESKLKKSIFSMIPFTLKNPTRAEASTPLWGNCTPVKMLKKKKKPTKCVYAYVS